MAAIIGMIAGLGGGYCVGTYKRLVVEKTARQLLLMATYARIMAIEQQRPYELQLDAGNRGFLLVTTEVNRQTGRDGADRRPGLLLPAGGVRRRREV